MANWDSVSSPIQTSNGGWDAVSSPIQQSQQPQGFFGREAADLTNRANQISNAYNQASAPAGNAKSIPRGVLDIMGNIGGAINDTAGNAIGSAARSVGDIFLHNDAEKQAVSDALKQGAIGFANTMVGRNAADVGNAIIGAVDQAKQQYPNTSAVIGDITNIASAIPIVKGVSALTEGAPGIVNAAKDALTSDTPLTSSNIADIKNHLYNAAETQGGILSPSLVNKTINDASKLAPQTAEGIAFAGENPTTKTINDLKGLQDKPLSLSAYDEIDKDLGKRIDNETDSFGNISPDGRNLIQIQQTLRNAVTNPDTVPEDLLNPEAFQTYRQAQQAASAGFKMGDIDRIYTKAQSADNPQTVIKNGFAKLRDSGMRGYTPEEQDAIKSAAKTGILTGALKVGGSKLISGIAGAVAGGAGAGVPGALLGTAAAEAGAYPLRKAAQALQTAKGNKVIQAISNRPVFNNLAKDIANMPASEAAKLLRK